MSIIEFLPIKELWSIIREYQGEVVYIVSQDGYDIIGTLLNIYMNNRCKLNISRDTENITLNIKTIHNLPKLTKLKNLGLSKVDWKKITINSKLKKLRLNEIKNLNIKDIQNFKTLKSLSINDCELFCDNDVYKLKNLPLQTLQLSHVDITNVGISYLQDMKLTKLSLNWCIKLNKNIASSINLLELTNLTLDNLNVEGITELLNFKKIKYYYLKSYDNPSSIATLNKYNIKEFQFTFCNDANLKLLNTNNIDTIILESFNEWSQCNYTKEALKKFKKINFKTKVIVK